MAEEKFQYPHQMVKSLTANISVDYGKLSVKNIDGHTTTFLSNGKQEIVLSKTVNTLGYRYFDVAKDIAGNVLYSPYLIASLMCIFMLGATSDTRKELASLLKVDENDDAELAKLFEKFQKERMKEYVEPTKLFTSCLCILNGNMVRKSLKEDFSRVIEESFNSEITKMPFTSSKISKLIANWAEEKTEGFVKNYSVDVKQTTVLQILCLLYFKADWKYKFYLWETGIYTFTKKNGEKTKIDFMKQKFKNKIKYYSDYDFHGIALPYKNELVSLYIIIPLRDDACDMENRWRAKSIYYREEFIKNIDNSPICPGTVKLLLPKFAIEAKNDMEVYFKKLGLATAFKDNAHFGRMIEELVKIERICQLVKMEIDENGTKMASMASAPCAAGPPPKEYDVVLFYVQRPFYFTLRDNKVGVDLFSGIVNSVVE